MCEVVCGCVSLPLTASHRLCLCLCLCLCLSLALCLDLPLHHTQTCFWITEAMYKQWKQDPSSVHASWRAFFELEGRGYGKGTSYTPPPGMNAATPVASSDVPGDMSLDDILFHVKVRAALRNAIMILWRVKSFAPCLLPSCPSHPSSPPTFPIPLHAPLHRLSASSVRMRCAATTLRTLTRSVFCTRTLTATSHPSSSSTTTSFPRPTSTRRL